MRRPRRRRSGGFLDRVVAVTGWSRDNRPAAVGRGGQAAPGRGQAGRGNAQEAAADTFSYGAWKVLQRVWAASGGQCGKYLVVSMSTQLDGLERHCGLVPGRGRCSAAVRVELMAHEWSLCRHLFLNPGREGGRARSRSAISVDELAAAVGVEDRHGEWEQLLQRPDAFQDPLGCVVAYRLVLGPSGHPVGQGRRWRRRGSARPSI
jgi:hypothetical protein